MSLNPDERPASSITLPPRLAIAEIATHHRGFCDALAEGGPIAIDAGAIERIDTTGLQCLTALVRTAGDRRQTVSWESVSPELAAAAARLGLTAALELPVTASATEG